MCNGEIVSACFISKTISWILIKSGTEENTKSYGDFKFGPYHEA
jgi:hypothetical protein